MEQFNSWIIKQYVAVTTLLVAEREEGQTLVEYGLLVALIAVICIAAVAAVGGGVRDTFTTIVGQL